MTTSLIHLVKFRNSLAQYRDWDLDSNSFTCVYGFLIIIVISSTNN